MILGWGADTCGAGHSILTSISLGKFAYGAFTRFPGNTDSTPRGYSCSQILAKAKAVG